jgi:hypothetical protein
VVTEGKLVLLTQQVSKLSQKTEFRQFSIFSKWFFLVLKSDIFDWFTWSYTVGLIYFYVGQWSFFFFFA